MAVDVVSSVVIKAPRAVVASYAVDPDRVTSWYANIKQVEWKTPRPLVIGTQVALVAQFLGRELAYTYEVREHVPGDRLVMSTSNGPFPMETTYTFSDAPGGGTLMTLRNRGEPIGFSRVAAPMMARSMARANRKDLDLLKAVVEGHAPAD